MDWLLALCIAGGFIIGMGLLLIIGFKSGEDSSAVHHAREVANLKSRITELEHEYSVLGTNWNKVEVARHEASMLAKEQTSRVQEQAKAISRYQHIIRQQSDEIRALKKGPGDFALDA